MDKWILGLQLLVIGLGAVFLVLLILIILILVMGKLAKGKTDKKTSETKKQAIGEIAVKPQDDENEVIAAIAAAIACMAQREGKKFKIRSFKRV